MLSKAKIKICAYANSEIVIKPFFQYIRKFTVAAISAKTCTEKPAEPYLEKTVGRLIKQFN